MKRREYNEKEGSTGRYVRKRVLGGVLCINLMVVIVSNGSVHLYGLQTGSEKMKGKDKWLHIYSPHKDLQDIIHTHTAAPSPLEPLSLSTNVLIRDSTMCVSLQTQ